jgi:ribosome-binding factor A
MATITDVKVSRDLKQARIYFTTSAGIQKKGDTIKGFSSAHGFIKRTLAHELGLKYMPDIKFFYDESLEYGAHIDELIETTKRENGSNHSTN